MNAFVTFILGIVFPKLIFKIKTNKKVVYLTFDDGPTPEVTLQVLSILKEFNAKATFFCLGKNVEQNKELFQQILDDGHSVGNHTHNHLKGIETSLEEYFDDIKNAQNHLNTNLFRPPYGRISLKQIKFISKYYKIVMWNVLSKDYDKKIYPEKCLHRVITRTKAGSIVVFHDSKKAQMNVLNVLPRYLFWLRENNFKCEAIED